MKVPIFGENSKNKQNKMAGEYLPGKSLSSVHVVIHFWNNVLYILVCGESDAACMVSELYRTR